MLQATRFFKSGYHNSKWFFVLLFLFVFYLTNSRQTKITNFDCEICADKAGYYMYLPALFQYGFEAKNYPDGFDKAHGDGFYMDKEHNKIITRFTCGVAVLQLPFYAAGALIAKVFVLDVVPYSNYYMVFINIGAAFYLVLGLYFLRRWLNYYVDDSNSFWTILVIFFGTNLYYYTLDESLMSHMYSFSLFSMLLFGLKAFNETKQYNYFILFVVSLSLSILIRPTNAIFALVALLSDVNEFDVLKNKIILLLKPKYIISAAVIFLLLVAPQLFYWKYAFGKYVVWSYGEYGFSYWDKPEFLIVWFSPQSGLFTYTPIILLSLIYAVFMFVKKERNALLIIGSFFVVSYMCAAWCNPFFGTCNFGKRPMVEFLPIVMLPIAYMFQYSKSYAIKYEYLLLILTGVFIYYNQCLFNAFDTCFFGGTWEWGMFGELLKRAFLLQ
ncbi:MAG TPA: hypothetical protein VK796_10945 [Cytophaga sp.]|jgi:hypothetical protein|nr:hypothetical protein [Cytophaga sp.]